MRLLSRIAVFAALLLPTAAHAQGADPAGSGPIVAAVSWLQGTLLGNVATLQTQVAANTTSINTLNTQVTNLFDLSEINRRDIRKANEGVAMALAMETPYLPAGTKFGVAGGLGYYQDRIAGTASPS